MKTKVELDELAPDTSHLLCPHCGEGYLHQGIVEVYNRPEDSDTVRCSIVGEENIFSAMVDNNTSNNPSSRRSGMLIHFDCEYCDGLDLKLNIAQHKGFTLMHWEYNDGSNPRS